MTADRWLLPVWMGMGMLALCLPTDLPAQVSLIDSIPHYVIGRQIHILEDREHQFRTLHDVRKPDVARRFVRSHQQTPNRGFSTASYWVRFDLSNQSHTWHPWLLEVGSGNFWSIDLYSITKKTGRITQKRGGEWMGRRGREVNHNTFLFHLPIQPGDGQTVYVRLVPLYGQALLPLHLWREEALLTSAQTSGFLWGSYYGFFLAVLLYHFVLFLFTRERNYLLLTAYLLAYLFYELSRVYCLGVRFLWPGHVWLTQHALSTSFSLTLISFLWLYSSVLNLKRVAPRLQTILYGFVGCIIVGWFVTLMQLPSVPENAVITGIGVLGGLFIMFLGGYCWYRGNHPARYYSAAALAIFVGGMVHSLNRAGVIPGSDFFVHYTLNLGSVLELVFLSIGLADTVRTERRERAQKLQTEIEAAELRGLAEERERMTGELHDGVGSSLLTLRQSVRNLRSQPNGTTTLESLEQLIQTTYNEVHQIANNLLPVEFEKKGLPIALRELLAKLNQNSKLHFFLLLSGQEDRLKPVVQYQLYLILIELINNVIKHAQATEAGIRFSIEGNLMRVTIQDNGIGLASDATNQIVNGQGWRTTRQRIARIGGDLTADSDEGLTVCLGIPIS